MSFLSLIARNLVRQRTRTLLTVLGIGIGITTVVALGSITQGMKATSEDLLRVGGADFMVAQKGAADLSFSTISSRAIVIGAIGVMNTMIMSVFERTREPPNAGRILVAGHDLASERDLPHYRARHVGIVFQLHNLLSNLTAAENVQVPMFELGISGRKRRERADRLAWMLDGCAVGEERPARGIRAATGGER